MALVVFLRGVNIGGHRTVRPAALAQQLVHLDALSIGAAGTFVIRRPVSRVQLREAFASRLPFDAHLAICNGREIVELMSGNFFPDETAGADIVRFAGILSAPSRQTPSLPMSFPPTGPWLVRIVARQGRFVLGQYRRHMKTIGYLRALDRVFGVPVTIRNWNTMSAIGKALANRSPARSRPAHRE